MHFVRVFLVDDHQLLTDALAVRLAAVSDIWVVGRAAPGDADLAELVAQHRPDIVVIELASVGMRSAALLAELTAAAPRSRLIVLTESHDAARAVDAARAGAAAWVHKDSPVDELVDVLHQVDRGAASYPPAELGEVLRELREDVRRARERSGPLDALTDRERDVLECMVEGRRPAQIATDLHVSANTVRTHIGRILAKLGARSSLEAVSMALATGLLPGPAEAGPGPGASVHPLPRPVR